MKHWYIQQNKKRPVKEKSTPAKWLGKQVWKAKKGLPLIGFRDAILQGWVAEALYGQMASVSTVPACDRQTYPATQRIDNHVLSDSTQTRTISLFAQRIAAGILQQRQSLIAVWAKCSCWNVSHCFLHTGHQTGCSPQDASRGPLCLVPPHWSSFVHLERPPWHS